VAAVHQHRALHTANKVVRYTFFGVLTW